MPACRCIRLWLATLAGCVWGLVAPRAWADEPPSARLELVVEAGVDGCPEPAELEGAVAARLGWMPFRDDGKLVVQVQIRRGAARLTGELRVTDAAGSERKRRTLEAASGACRELGDALGLAISVAIDPTGAYRPPPAPPVPVAAPPPAPRTAAPVAVAPPPPPPSRPAVSPPPPRRGQLRAGAGVCAPAPNQPGV